VSQVEALYLSTLVISSSHYLLRNVERAHHHQSDVELEGHRQSFAHIVLEVVL